MPAGGTLQLRTFSSGTEAIARAVEMGAGAAQRSEALGASLRILQELRLPLQVSQQITEDLRVTLATSRFFEIAREIELLAEARRGGVTLDAARKAIRLGRGLAKGTVVTILVSLAIEAVIGILDKRVTNRLREELSTATQNALREVSQASVVSISRSLVRNIAETLVSIQAIPALALQNPPRVSFRADLARFNKSLHRAWDNIADKQAGNLRQQTRLVLQRCVDYTPPFSGKRLSRMLKMDSFGNESAKTFGERRVKQDILRVFVPVNTLKIWRTVEGFKEAADKRDAITVSRLLPKAFHFSLVANDPYKPLYYRQKNRRGNVRHKPDQQLVLDEGPLRDFIRQRQRWVGYAKSGWKPAAKVFGLKMSNWVMRHNGDGFGRDLTDQALMKTQIGNSVAYIQETGRELKIIELAVSDQAASYQASIRRTLKESAKELETLNKAFAPPETKT